MSEQETERRPGEVTEQVSEQVTEQTGRDPMILAAMGSVLLAWAQFYLRGNKEAGLFVGLWPPTLLAFSNAFKINDINEKIDQSTTNLLDRLLQRQ